MQRKRLSRLIITAMLMALAIVLERFLGIETDLVKLNFSFLPLAAAAALYGPLWGGAAFFLADLFGMLLFSRGAVYFPLFGVSEFLFGVIFGLFLYKKEKTLLRAGLSVAVSSLVITLGLTPLWNVLYMKLILGKSLSYTAVWLTKVAPALILIPVKTLCIYLLWKYAGKYMEKYTL